MVAYYFLLHPEHWRERAEETRAKADNFSRDATQRLRLLRVAEEYERLAERAAHWRTASEAEQQSTP